jgi:hypothetical protein
LNDPVQRLLGLLHGVKPGGEGQWAACCPAHDDGHASLSVSRGDDGRALVHCHAGCTPEAICKALGLDVRDLFCKQERRIVATYDYRDASGTLLFQAVRYEPKEFSQRRPDGRGGWIWNMSGVARVLYHLPELHAADPAATVFIVEGEKDVHSLEALGLVATCNPMGAEKWKLLSDDSVLQGRRVVIVQDGDDPGRRHALDVAGRLHGRAAELRIMDAPEGHHDVSDWITARDSQGADELRNQILAVAQAAPAFSPAVAQKANEPELILRRISDVKRETLQWLWQGRIPLGKLTLLAGDPGLGKSILTLDLAARVSRGLPWPDNSLLAQPVGVVILFNAEDDVADTIAERLDRAGADDRHLENVLVANPGVRLIVVDPISAYCGKIDSHNNTEVRSLLVPLAELASRHKAAAIAVTHLSKSGGTKAVYRAIGSLAFTAAARAVWSVVKDPNDQQRRLFLPAKFNLGPEPDGMAYRIKEGRVEWEADPVKMHADEAFAAEAAATNSRGDQRRNAEAWLKQHLAQGPMLKSQVVADADEQGFTERTVRRAFKALRGRSKKLEKGAEWTLPASGQLVT